MKNAKFELFARMQRQYHRSNPWHLSGSGLYIPHSYTDTPPGSLSWWDDVGFILNKRRVIVWWQHPRQAYADAIGEQSGQEAGDGPLDDRFIQGATKNFKRVGKSKSRKKLAGYTCAPLSPERRAYYDLLQTIHTRLSSQGIDLDISPSWSRERLNWAMGVSLVAPLEVRNEAELAAVADLARRLMLGKTTLGLEFAGYCYGRADWLAEQKTPNLIQNSHPFIQKMAR